MYSHVAIQRIDCFIQAINHYLFITRNKRVAHVVNEYGLIKKAITRMLKNGNCFSTDSPFGTFVTNIYSMSIHYLTPEDLARAIQQARDGDWNNLYAALRQIVNELSCSPACPDVGSEDLLHDTCIVVIKVLDRIDTSRNVFAYLTQVIKNEIMYKRRNQRVYQKRFKGMSDKDWHSWMGG